MRTNNYNLPLPLLAWMLKDDYEKGEADYSITELMKPTRYIILEKRYPKLALYNEDVSDLFYSRLGTAIHTAIEESLKDKDTRNKALKMLGYPESTFRNMVINPKDVLPNQIPLYLENHRVKEIEGVKVGGTADLIMGGRLIDYKTTTTYNFAAGWSDNAWKEQLNGYRWLFSDLITSTEADVYGILRDYSSTIRVKDAPPIAMPIRTFDLSSTIDAYLHLKQKIQELQHYDRPEVHDDDLPYATDEELGVNPPTYKYFRKITQSRASSNHNNLESALAAYHKNGTGMIKKYVQEPYYFKFCRVKDKCKQYQEMKDGYEQIVDIS